MTAARSDGLFGVERRRHALDGITLSHRIASVPPETIGTHTHDDAHFVFVTGGIYVTSARGEAQGDKPVFIYNPPGTCHRDRFGPDLGSYFAISVSTAKLAALGINDELPEEAVHLDGLRPRRAMNRILQACRRGVDSRLFLEGLCLELLNSFSRRTAPKAPPWLDVAMACIEDCYADHLSVDDVARVADVHPVHLTRTFRQQLGCTPGEMLRARRLEKAASLLTGTDMPLVEIALTMGFPDQPNFTRRFGEAYGVPPGEYRRLTRCGRQVFV